MAALGVREVGRRFRDGSLTPSRYLEELLGRITEQNPKLNAFLEVFSDDARREAAQATADLGAGRDRGPLHGIPVGVKDLFDIAGRVTTAGAHRDFHPPPAAKDAVVVHMLREAGAVILGKTGLHEWALGVTSNNAHFGPVRNPHDPTRIPGGSSGGSGAAVAAGLCPLALGTDTGGSIRIPSSLCGTVGIKPTTGLVSGEGLAPLSRSLDTAGPMAASVEDAFLMLEAISDFKRKDVRRARVLLAKNYFFDDIHPEVNRLVREAASRLGSVEEMEIPGAQKAWEQNPVILLSEAAAVHEARLRDHPERFGPGMADRFQDGFKYRGIDFARALAYRDEWRMELLRLLAMPPSVLIVPATPIPAPLIGDREGAPIARILTRFTSPFNLAGMPVLSVPVGKVDGLPVGMQIVGPSFGESLLWAVGKHFD